MAALSFLDSPKYCELHVPLEVQCFLHWNCQVFQGHAGYANYKIQFQYRLGSWYTRFVDRYIKTLKQWKTFTNLWNAKLERSSWAEGREGTEGRVCSSSCSLPPPPSLLLLSLLQILVFLLFSPPPPFLLYLFICGYPAAPGGIIAGAEGEYSDMSHDVCANALFVVSPLTSAKNVPQLNLAGKRSLMQRAWLHRRRRRRRRRLHSTRKRAPKSWAPKSCSLKTMFNNC